MDGLKESCPRIDELLGGLIIGHCQCDWVELCEGHSWSEVLGGGGQRT